MSLLEGQRLLFAGLVVAGGIVVGMFLESATMTTIGTLVALAGAVISPPLGLVTLALMGPLRQPLVLPPPGFNLMLVGAILLGCLYRLPSTRPTLRIDLPLVLLSAFVLYAFVQQLPEMMSGYVGTRAHDIGFLFLQMLTGLLTIVAGGLVMRGRSPMVFLAALLISATVAAVLGIATASDVPTEQLENLLAPPGVASRATGPFGNPNAFGQLLAYAAALAVACLAYARSLRVRTALIAVLVIMAYALSLSLSRGAVAAFGAGLVALAFSRNRALGLTVSVAAALVILVAYPVFVEWRLLTEAGAASPAAAADLAASDQGRLTAILAGPTLFATSPIFGIGFGQYQYLTPLVTATGAGLVAHNWYGTVLAEQGLLGIALWIGALLAFIVALRSRPTTARSVGSAVLGAVVVGFLFLQPPTSFQMSIVPAIALTATVVGAWDDRKARAEEPAARGSEALDRPVPW